jgi:hypothetical protein
MATVVKPTVCSPGTSISGRKKAKVVPPVSIDLASGTETSEPRAVESVWISLGLKLLEKDPCL